MDMSSTLLPHVNDRGQKSYRAETHRVVSPADTIARLRPHLKGMGITRIGNVTGLDSIGLPTVVVCRPNSRSLAVSQGKGLTLDAAKASALMESVECFHAEEILAPLMLASAAEMARRHRVVDIFELPRTTGIPLDRDTTFLWMEGFDLMDGAPRFVPFESVHINSTMVGRVNAGIFCCSTNGLSSGNHLLEAVSYGICEVVERDSLTVWSVLDADAREATRVALDTIDDARCKSVLAMFEAAGVAVAVWEVTSDVGIPAFTCLIADKSEDTLRSLHSAAGQGCHPTRGIALLRALTEAAQTRLTVISGSRDDVLRGEYDRHRNPDQLRQTRALIEGNGRGPRSFRDAPSFEAGESFEDDVRWEIDRLRLVGIGQVVVHDLTKPELGIPVAKVVVPGLEANHSYPNYRFGPRAAKRAERS
jgi:ribosomal protein S12 methylthiotransferase accessory factor